MFSNPITSPLLRERSLPYRGTTLTTLLDSRLTVFATAPPQPASNDLASTRAFVPGGPEPSKNGFGNLIPLTVMDRSIWFAPIADCQLPIALISYQNCLQIGNRQLAIGNRQCFSV